MTNDQPATAIRFDVGREGDVPVVSIIGSLADEASSQAKEVFLRLVGEKPSRILVDLSGMDYISSSGIGLLVSVLRRCRQCGITMSLCCLQPEVTELFKLTRLHQVFEIFENRATAIKPR